MSLWGWDQNQKHKSQLYMSGLQRIDSPLGYWLVVQKTSACLQGYRMVSSKCVGVLQRALQKAKRVTEKWTL